jgi:hypothetical protein
VASGQSQQGFVCTCSHWPWLSGKWSNAVEPKVRRLVQDGRRWTEGWKDGWMLLSGTRWRLRMNHHIVGGGEYACCVRVLLTVSHCSLTSTSTHRLVATLTSQRPSLSRTVLSGACEWRSSPGRTVLLADPRPENESFGSFVQTLSVPGNVSAGTVRDACVWSSIDKGGM